MERGALSPCPTRRLAGLLLAGTVLVSAPAFAQQNTSAFPAPLAGQQAAATDPLSTATTETIDPAAITPDATTTASTPAITDEGDTFARTGRETEQMNAREGSVDGARSNFGNPYEPTGIRVGSFILRPSISQNLGHEKNSSGGVTTRRTYSQTGLRGSLVSDWSRHQLSVEAEGIYQRNISGTGETEPRLRLDTDLRLDLSDSTIANITAGYDFERESSSDPNAINGATAQSGVHTYSAGARVTRDFGLIRGTIGAEVERRTYGSATLADGSQLVLSDRNYTEGTLTGRVGYELSPALIPYLEASVGRSSYDDKYDSLGYERSATTLGGRAGVELDLGEKLRGDLGLGYERARFDDTRLVTLDALTLDGTVQWSPQRGTDLRLGLATELEPSTAAGQSGYVSYEATSELTHELRENLVARLSAAYTLRDFKNAGNPNQTIYLVGTGITWNINRWLAMTGDVSYELTRQRGTSDTGVTRAGIGLVLRR
ncbi:outer membrane beta-barrel protein [Shinella zoogloeoides]|uniref:Outer membrane beta-barrel protein n=1 Tax=Shinella zoogloeoides TaxID=352475 RepID=A0A6N8TF77_SHIZO|nr:outer membrane beta-barrel protein [Shinella zoogloeoides]MXN99853.1 outer membrane beta-barrel protein [Shinella zoogloeoides]UEX80661.1 outer membrane beta-barrel protein [Shinella zoogloeoides]